MALRRAVSWLVLVVFATGTGWAATRNVVAPPASCSDSTCAPCCTIQGAVVLSSGGDVIIVAPGSYPENIDFRAMASVGNITLEALSGPGTVFVSPTSGHTVRHGDGHTNTVTIDGLDFDSVATKSCVYLDHAGDVVLRDVTANTCGYTAFVLDNTGSVTMEGCTANQSQRTGIQVDGATGVTLVDCTANSNASNGISVYSPGGSVQITNPTTNNNIEQGIDLNVSGPLIITGATVMGSGGTGIWAWSTSTVEISSSLVSASQEDGVVLETGDLIGSIDGATLTGLQSNGNGLGSTGSGLYIEDLDGPAVLTSCTFDGNADDGVEISSSDLDDLELTGGHADGNGRHGFGVEAVGDAVVVGTHAHDNGDRGFSFDMTGIVSMENCGANGNEAGSGVQVSWLEPDTLDEVSITGCTANDNGLADGGNGVYVKHVEGPVTIVGTTTNGNSRTGVRVDSTAGAVRVSDAVSNSGLEEGIKIDADVGPVTVEHCTVDDNDLEGLKVRREDVDVETVTVTRNMFTNNGLSGVVLEDLAAGGSFDATCNDIAGNGDGLYLNSAVTVDARYGWWGDPSGPSAQGPGGGDTVFAEPGGTILFNPWFTESCVGCNGVVNLTLSNESVISSEEHEACYSMTVGPNYGVYGPNGYLTLTAPRITFLDGFFVGVDGALAAGSS